MTSDGHRLRQSWSTAFDDAESRFRQLLTLHSPTEWKKVSQTKEVPALNTTGKGKGRALAQPDVSDVIVHRRTEKSGEPVYRAVLEVNLPEDTLSLETWKAILVTPELRQDWDPSVEEAQLVEMFDVSTRISRTRYTLGWPANPRDSVTISRSIHDATTFIDISTSLPRSADEPTYLRPSPPYVRSNVTLLAWCIQILQPQTPVTTEEREKRKKSIVRLRITCFSQHDLRAVWNFGSSTSVPQQLRTAVVGLFKTVASRGSRVPTLTGYGHGVTVEKLRFQLDREALSIDYAIVPDEEHDRGPDSTFGLDKLQAHKEQKRLTRAIECALPSPEGWDVRITTRASSEAVEKLPYKTIATRQTTFPHTITFRVEHAAVQEPHSVLRVKIVLELSRPSKGLRLNGLPQTIMNLEERDLTSPAISPAIMQEAASMIGQSIYSVSTAETTDSAASGHSRTPSRPTTLVRTNTERTAAGEKSILSRVRRSYIYFSSLLQEPEAKWKRTTEARGVSVTQLDSIDPTLILYRAEATFVGIGLWDLFSTLASPGARIYWDKQHEDAVLLEDVNELTNLWHYKTRAAWPTNGRDSIVLKTVYKSPTTIHLFSFSADDPYLFPNVPPADPNIIRTQVDLRGWAIEALSPNTTSLTLLEQSDPKGWSNKASIPQQMIADVAGVGEFVIKYGGPPTVTRLLGAKTNQMRYDHERGSFRVEYEACAARRPPAPTPSSDQGEGAAATAEADGDTTTTAASIATNGNTMPTIECEIRCDVDTWASSLDIVIDPPPQTIHALRRHRLSTGGGGLWLTISHDAVLAGGEERILAIIRRGVGVGGKDKGVVMVNGAKLAVDIEELPDAEIKQLARQKRVKPARIPLDQPPVMGVIRKRREEWESDTSSSPDKAASQQQQSEASTSTPAIGINTSGWMAQPAMPSPLSKWFTSAIEQATTTTRQAVAALTPAAAAAASSGEDLVLSSSKPPMQCALEALAWIQDYYSRPSVSTDGWTPIADKSISLHWRSVPSLSPAISIHRGEKVIEGVSAEELASIITSDGCRAQWDESFSSATIFESFGAGCQTSFVVSKAGFPFRDRGFYVASVMAYSPVASSSSSSSSTAASSTAAATTTGSLRRRANSTEADRPVDGRNTIFCVSASFNPESLSSFATTKYNPSSLPTGRVFLDGWILETLDPYTTEKYAIPSARCVRLAAVDFAGAIPGAVNASMNVALARGVSAVDSFVKRSTGGGNGNGSGSTAAGGAGSVSVPTCRLPAPAMMLTRRKPGEEEEQEDNAAAANAIAANGSAGAIAVSAGPAAASAGGKAPMAWRLRWRDEERMCLGSSFVPASRTYWSILVLKLADRAGARGSGSSGSGRNASEDRTPKSSRIGAYGALRAPPSPPPSGTAIPMTAPPAGGNNDTPSSEAPAEASGSSSSTLSTSSFRGRDRSLSSPPGDHHFHNHKQLRSSSSVFTVRGEVRPATDLLAAELVVDTKLYPEGYEITVHSRVRVHGGGGHSTSASDAVFLPAEPTMTSAPGSSGGVLPFAYAVYTMPLSPLHSAGLHADRPPRHLVRLTLPTGQYQQSTVQDPLTGEMRGARPKPGWLVDLQEKGAVVEVRVAPITSVRGARAVGAGTGKSVVKINGVDVAVVGEKDSLTSLGREELQDERVSRMPVLSRVFGQDQPEFPKELQVAAARSESILDPAALSGVINGQSQETTVKDVKVVTHESSNEKMLKDPEPPTSQQSNGTQSVMGTATSSTTTAAATGLLGFLRPYPTALSLFSSPSSRSPSGSNAGTSGVAIASKPDNSTTTQETDASSSETTTGTANTTAGAGTMTVRPRDLQHYSYPLSTVVIVGLIAFLIGSLLRSLLSPADFIYVVTDVGEVEGVEAGWREIRRLVEVKYLFGGWDFQIAAVRRH